MGEQTENVLFECKEIERPNKSLQVIFDGNNWDQDEINLNELHLTLFRLINALEKSKMIDFILRVKITSKQKINAENEQIKKWLNVLAMMEKNYLIHYQFSTKKTIDTFIFTISNKQCK